ncbi:class I SAM-dependent methyltransferase [Salinibacterium sp. PAMC 21357]|uniref:class I SAM-dependent methyltransferase n=1 Tax=Salinibacterium sp. PAMC 21357 TaxID=1112215 RepID=UPI003078BB18
MSNERYTHGHHESVLKSHTWRTIANSAAYFEPHLEVGLSLLDIGCGPGTITAEFAERLAPGRVVGLDAAAAVLEKASAFTADNLSFIVGDAYALPFDDNSFDLVHSHQTLQHLGDPVAALVEMKRVAKPGGLIAVRDVDYAGTICFPELPGLRVWAELYDAVHRSNGGEPNAGRRLKAWAFQAGLTDLTVTASVWNFSDDTDREWWGSMWEARVLSRRLRRML